jgi:hypothetical protein
VTSSHEGTTFARTATRQCMPLENHTQSLFKHLRTMHLHLRRECKTVWFLMLRSSDCVSKSLPFRLTTSSKRRIDLNSASFCRDVQAYLRCRRSVKASTFWARKNRPTSGNSDRDQAFFKRTLNIMILVVYMPCSHIRVKRCCSASNCRVSPVIRA